MIKKCFLTTLAFVLCLVVSTSFAAIDVNKADQAGLDGVRGIGPSLSKAILAERTKGGAFKNWADLESRVKGISDKNSVRFSKEGLQVNGQSKEGAAPAAATPDKNANRAAPKAVPIETR